MYCIYMLSVTARRAIRLTFEKFDVENVANSYDCSFDSVKVYDWFVDETKHGELLGRYYYNSLYNILAYY